MWFFLKCRQENLVSSSRFISKQSTTHTIETAAKLISVLPGRSLEISFYSSCPEMPLYLVPKIQDISQETQFHWYNVKVFNYTCHRQECVFSFLPPSLRLVTPSPSVGSFLLRHSAQLLAFTHTCYI